MAINKICGNVAVVLLYHVGFTFAKYCSYRTAYGYEYKFCPETCCRGFDARFDVCCGYENYNTAYIGGSLGALVSIAVLVLCCTYICCKSRLARTSRVQNSRRRSNTRLRPESRQRNNVIPSVSLSIQPTLPPPYDTLPPPPPYYPLDSTVGGSGKNSDKTQYPDHPPPEYTETVDSNPHLGLST